MGLSTEPEFLNMIPGIADGRECADTLPAYGFEADSLTGMTRRSPRGLILAGAGCCLLGVLQAGLFAHYMHSLILAVFSLLAWVRFGIWAIRLGQKRLREEVNT